MYDNEDSLPRECELRSVEAADDEKCVSNESYEDDDRYEIAFVNQKSTEKVTQDICCKIVPCIVCLQNYPVAVQVFAQPRISNVEHIGSLLLPL